MKTKTFNARLITATPEENDRLYKLALASFNVISKDYGAEHLKWSQQYAGMEDDYRRTLLISSNETKAKIIEKMNKIQPQKLF